MFIVHLMHADKFTLPLKCELQQKFHANQHHFLLLGQTEKKSECETVLAGAGSWQFLKNFWHVGLQFRKADLIIMHGLPVLYYFLFFPCALKKVAWVIYGGADLYIHHLHPSTFKIRFLERLRSFVLKNVKVHLTHVKGDATLANQIYGSKAAWYYHPVYLSNVVAENDVEKNINQRKHSPIAVLVGSSTDPSNNHLEVFEWLKDLDNIQIYCPLSYGPYEEYKGMIKKKGVELFGNRFTPVEHFMKFEAYKSFLDSMDVAIFNHKRQEAMGVTLTLLSLGKEVYAKGGTTSFESFSERGFQLFDNMLLKTEKEKLATRNISANATLLQKYYSKQVWEAQWKQLYNFNSIDEFS